MVAGGCRPSCSGTRGTLVAGWRRAALVGGCTFVLGYTTYTTCYTWAFGFVDALLIHGYAITFVYFTCFVGCHVGGLFDTALHDTVQDTSAFEVAGSAFAPARAAAILRCASDRRREASRGH